MCIDTLIELLQTLKAQGRTNVAFTWRGLVVYRFVDGPAGQQGIKTRKVLIK